jgi:hypothetical protein
MKGRRILLVFSLVTAFSSIPMHLPQSDDGAGLDPHGFIGSANREAGSAMDPNGSNGDAGSRLEPNGQH